MGYLLLDKNVIGPDPLLCRNSKEFSFFQVWTIHTPQNPMMTTSNIANKSCAIGSLAEMMLWWKNGPIPYASLDA